MKVFRDPVDLAPFYGGLFVPTMGALHAGHRALIAAARAADGDRPVIVSIFVNPTQFGPTEDFEWYPRPIEEDLEFCRTEEVDVVFQPLVETIYPPGFATRVIVPALSDVLCGARRPGHFEGVVTVVARLFGLMRPRAAFFGWKDAQQLVIIRRMAKDLLPGIEIVGVPTVREADGLAVSSRNRYLAPEERRRAARFPEALRIGMEAILRGEVVGGALRKARSHLEEGGLVEEYVELRRLNDLGEIPPDRPLDRAPAGEEYLLAGAVRIGETRLIDNRRLTATGAIT